MTKVKYILILSIILISNCDLLDKIENLVGEKQNNYETEEERLFNMRNNLPHKSILNLYPRFEQVNDHQSKEVQQKINNLIIHSDPHYKQYQEIAKKYQQKIINPPILINQENQNKKIEDKIQTPPGFL